ncbi:chaperone protein DnaJ [Candidatus Nitrosomarinus catalina]|uniref:Chaperone protein DnaJ n=1 Tax=Candidatus Nitrosomarinus catalinensis TaxID=1898749 RepID=A0A2Z2HR76_9ARCH|nr:J domain-containing protein [Candidatus Nitrosomarinus catalina]ARS64856.1 chaperone protein DnaJ [Candidatus Nitrosomarinus catalina]
MSATFETLFGLQFCQYKCGTYIGFSDDEMSSDGQSHKPLDAKTGKVHECPNEGWSKQKTCFGCGQPIQFHNSHVYHNGEKKTKIRFDSPGVRHSCTQQSYNYEHNAQDDHQSHEKQNQQEEYEKDSKQQFRTIDDEQVIEAYAVFGLDHNATLEQIKSTFREFALKYHPDKNKSPTATAMMVRINYAYEVITQWWKNND